MHQCCIFLPSKSVFSKPNIYHFIILFVLPFRICLSFLSYGWHSPNAFLFSFFNQKDFFGFKGFYFLWFMIIMWKFSMFFTTFGWITNKFYLVSHYYLLWKTKIKHSFPHRQQRRLMSNFERKKIMHLTLTWQ